MSEIEALKIFENKNVRVLWSEEEEKWYFSIVDIIQILTESNNSRRYWSDLKIKLKEIIKYEKQYFKEGRPIYYLDAKFEG